MNKDPSRRWFPPVVGTVAGVVASALVLALMLESQDAGLDGRMFEVRAQGRFGLAIRRQPGVPPAPPRAFEWAAFVPALRDGFHGYLEARRPGSGDRLLLRALAEPDQVLCAGLAGLSHAQAHLMCRRGGIRTATFEGCGLTRVVTECG